MATVKHQYDFTVSWEPFLLKPHFPPEGAKIENLELRQSMLMNVARAGQEVGIDFTMKSDRIPNTLQAHALMEYCKGFQNGQTQNDLAEAVFKAFFTDGLYPADDNLLNIAEGVGLDRDQAKAVIQSEVKLEAAKEKARQWAIAGVSAVPMFYMNGQRVFSGAQDELNYVRMFEIVAERFPLPANPKSAY